MHFRVRKQVVQLVRMTYDSAIKRGRAQVVASVPLAQPELSPELRAQLTEEEIAEFDTWVATHHRQHMLKQELAALTLAEQIELARLWLEQQGERPVVGLLTEEWQRSWKALRRAIIKHGFDN